MLTQLNTEELFNFPLGHIIAGVDEVGRGPLAGPVIAAAVILGDKKIDEINDSKLLQQKKRKELAKKIKAYCKVGIGIADITEIDTLNILHASMLAMKRAIANLDIVPDFALIDGNRLPKNLPCKAEAVIKGDTKIASIAAASIVAKVTRDNIMQELHEECPYYEWDKNMGYGTKSHLQALSQHGVTTHHRRSFTPVKKALNQYRLAI